MVTKPQNSKSNIERIPEAPLKRIVDKTLDEMNMPFKISVYVYDALRVILYKHITNALTKSMQITYSNRRDIITDDDVTDAMHESGHDHFVMRWDKMDLEIKREPFDRVAREIAKSLCKQFLPGSDTLPRFSDKPPALIRLQSWSELYLGSVIAEACRFTATAGRKTLMAKDIENTTAFISNARAPPPAISSHSSSASQRRPPPSNPVLQQPQQRVSSSASSQSHSQSHSLQQPRVSSSSNPALQQTRVSSSSSSQPRISSSSQSHSLQQQHYLPPPPPRRLPTSQQQQHSLPPPRQRPPPPESYLWRD